jgi:hypothetical protein
MYSLAELRSCQEELARRENAGAGDQWFWRLRGKVIAYWISRQERIEGAGESIEGVSPVGNRDAPRPHPLLEARPPRAFIAPAIGAPFNPELQRRVSKFVARLEARR